MLFLESVKIDMAHHCKTCKCEIRDLDVHYLAHQCGARLCYRCIYVHIDTSTEAPPCVLCNRVGCYWVMVWPVVDLHDMEVDDSTPS